MGVLDSLLFANTEPSAGVSAVFDQLKLMCNTPPPREHREETSSSRDESEKSNSREESRGESSKRREEDEKGQSRGETEPARESES